MKGCMSSPGNYCLLLVFLLFYFAIIWAIHFWILQDDEGEIQMVEEFEREEFLIEDDPNSYTTELSEFLVDKFTRALDENDPYVFRGVINTSVGGFCNTLRGLFSTILFCIFADCVPIIQNGVGRNHRGNMLDYVALRDPRLQSYMRYAADNIGWGVGGAKPTEQNEYRSYEDNLPEIDKIIKGANIGTISEVDGPNSHLCAGKICTTLKTVGNFDYEDGLITREISTAEVFGPQLRDHEGPTAALFQNNNVYAQHVIFDEKKTELMCDLGMCRGLEGFMFDSDIIKRNDQFPIIGYPFIGHRMWGNVYKDLFHLNPRIQPVFDQIWTDNVHGFLLGVQIRASWMDGHLGPTFSCPSWDEWVRAVAYIINEGEAADEMEISVFISCDLQVPHDVVKKIYDISDRVTRVFNNHDYNFNRFVGNVAFEGQLYQEEQVIATVFDYEFLGRSDISIILFVSSFGHMSGYARSRLPSYVHFGGGHLPPKGLPGGNEPRYRKARVVSWWVERWAELDPYRDWMFDIHQLSQKMDMTMW